MWLTNQSYHFRSDPIELAFMSYRGMGWDASIKRANKIQNSIKSDGIIMVIPPRNQKGISNIQCTGKYVASERVSDKMTTDKIRFTCDACSQSSTCNSSSMCSYY